MEIITAENLKYVYKSATGEKIALDGLNLKIFSGEFVAIIGTNGSGKSTLAKHFNALLNVGLSRVHRLMRSMNLPKNFSKKISELFVQI